MKIKNYCLPITIFSFIVGFLTSCDQIFGKSSELSKDLLEIDAAKNQTPQDPDSATARTIENPVKTTEELEIENTITEYPAFFNDLGTVYKVYKPAGPHKVGNGRWYSYNYICVYDDLNENLLCLYDKAVTDTKFNYPFYYNDKDTSKYYIEAIVTYYSSTKNLYDFELRLKQNQYNKSFYAKSLIFSSVKELEDVLNPVQEDLSEQETEITE